MRSTPVGALGGPLAAQVIAEAAVIIEAIARAPLEGWAEAGGSAAQAGALQRRAAELGGVDVEVHATAADLLWRRAQLDPERRDWEIGRALAGAAGPPLELVQTAADVTILAAEVAECCNPDLRPDAVAACLLAEAGGRAAAHLLEVNLSVTADDERLALARASLTSMRRATDGVLAGG